MKVTETATITYEELSDDIKVKVIEKVMETAMYAAIRKCCDDGHEWIDTDTLSYLLDCSQQSVMRTAEKIPLWHENNPVVRYARIRLNEETE
jgi:hypothetical protein